MWTIQSCRNEFKPPLANGRAGIESGLTLNDLNSIHVN